MMAAASSATPRLTELSYCRYCCCMIVFLFFSVCDFCSCSQFASWLAGYSGIHLSSYICSELPSLLGSI